MAVGNCFTTKISVKHIRRTEDRTRDFLNVIRTVLAGPADDQTTKSVVRRACVRVCMREALLLLSSCVFSWITRKFGLHVLFHWRIHIYVTVTLR